MTPNKTRTKTNETVDIWISKTATTTIQSASVEMTRSEYMYRKDNQKGRDMYDVTL
jgi:CYTH domain-containing protein